MTGAGGEIFDHTQSYVSPSSGKIHVNDVMTVPNGVEPKLPTVQSRVSGYEEFGGMLCPTCNGTGRIPRGQEDDLVALIPYRDGRLKPRRTWLWVVLSILGCAVVAGILCFILIPRDIKMGEPLAETYRAELNKTEKHLLIELNFMFNVTNNNYVPVTVKEIDVEAQLYDQVIGKTKYNHSSNVHSRTTTMLTVPLNVSVEAIKSDSYIMTICDPDATIPYPHLLYLTFDLTMHTQLLSQEKENSLNTYPIHVSCVTPSHL